MARLDGLRRAPASDDAAKSSSTLETYERRGRRYEKWALEEAKVDPLDGTRVFDFFLKAASRSVAYARKQIPAVAMYFRSKGKGSAFPHEAVLSLLRERSANARDPLGHALTRVRLPRPQFYRARAIAGKASAATRYRYGQFGEFWETYCDHYHLPPMACSVRQFKAFLVFYGLSHRYRSMSNLCNAVSHYFRNAGVYDLTRDPEIRRFLAVVAKEDARTSKFIPLFAEHLKKMVGPLTDAPLDVRDRVMMLIIYYGTAFASDLSIMENDVVLSEEGAEVFVEGEAIFIGGVDDPDLDIRIWLRKWLEILGTQRRPLFPSMTYRGAMTFTSLSNVRICSIVKKAAARAGVSTDKPTLALRKGFAIRVARIKGVAQTARHMRMKRVGSLAVHITLPDLGRKRLPKARQVAVPQAGVGVDQNVPL